MESGVCLSGFTVLRLLGEGGMGRVCLAEDTQLRRQVALKTLVGEATPQERARLLREARVAAALNHPGICTIHQVIEAGGQVVIVMEYVDGRTIGQLLPSDGFDGETLVRYAEEVADALAYAHARGVVHRDLKPANLMVGPEGRLKILDFGLARRRLAADPDGTTLGGDSPVTTKGEILGTLHYMAPELLGGEVATPASDVWALGVCLYEMASGRRPFTAPTSFGLSAAILDAWPAPLPPRVPAGVAALIQRCLQKQPAHRYPHAGEVRAALARISPARASSGPVVVVPPPAAAEGARVLDSIAVLPLRNMSGDPGQEFFSDGLTEALINDLAKIRALKVISRTSVMRHKGSDRPLPDIARELGVRAIVEGSVLRAGDQVQVMVRLVDAASDASVWAERYVRPIGDLFELQSDVTGAIAREVRVAVTPQERRHLGPAAPVAPAVYEAYLKGRHFWNMRTGEGFARAIEHLRQAIALDAGYPLPLAVMADTMLLLGVYGFRRPRDVYPAALQMVRRALDLDEALAEAHSTLGWGLQLFDLDRPNAERAYCRALELNPGHVATHLRYGAYLMGVRRTGEGLAMLARGVELDPLSMIQRALLAYGHYLAREFDRAIEIATSSLDLDPRFWWTHWALAEVYRATDRLSDAIRHLGMARALSPDNAFIEGPLGAAYAAAGRRPEAEAVLAAMTGRAERQYVAPYFVGLIHLALGDRDRAFACFGAAVDERDSWISFCAVNPALDAVRDDPRLAIVMRQMQVDW